MVVFGQPSSPTCGSTAGKCFRRLAQIVNVGYLYRETLLEILLIIIIIMTKIRKITASISRFKNRNPVILRSKPKKKIATFVYNEDVAKSFHTGAMQYYKVESERIVKVMELENVKKKYIRRIPPNPVDDLIAAQIVKAKFDRIKPFKVINRIKEKVKHHVQANKPLPVHNDLLGLVANPHMLIQAYRTIRGKRGAMTRGWWLPTSVVEKLEPRQKEIVDFLNEIPSGISLKAILNISSLVKSGKYPWGCSKLIWIPKPGTTKMRPITIPPFGDRLVQEAIRMVLEAIYEPVFQKQCCSFGFRASNGVHECITRLREPRYTAGLHMAIEGDIESAYPNLRRDKLLQILSVRIKDNKFIKFMKKRLNLMLYDVAKEAYEQTWLGIPQGGIDSPYLWNIYLMGMDEFVTKDLQKYLEDINAKRLVSKARGKPPSVLTKTPINPLYNQLDKKLVRLRKQIRDLKVTAKQDSSVKDKLYSLMRERRLLSHKKRNTRYTDHTRTKLKMIYTRYADDFIIVTNAPRHILLKMKAMLADWLKTNLLATLSDEKTLITDLRRTEGHFLGFELRMKNTRRVANLTVQGKKQTKRTTGWQMTVLPDSTRLINRLFMKGYCERDGFPREMAWLSTFDMFTLIQKFNSVLRGFANFYAGFVNYKSSLYRWLYIVRYSCLKTLACKYKTNISGVFKRFGNKITYNAMCFLPNGDPFIKTVTLEEVKDVVNTALKLNRFQTVSYRLLSLEKGIFVEYDPVKVDKNGNKRRNRTPRILDIDFLDAINWTNRRTEGSLNAPCLVCGEPDTVMHHVRHVRHNNILTERKRVILKNKNKKRSILVEKQPGLEQLMQLRNRKCVPLCTFCHNEVHNGTFTSNVSFKTYDTRVVDLDARIVPKPYKGPENLEAKLISKGWRPLQDALLSKKSK